FHRDSAEERSTPGGTMADKGNLPKQQVAQADFAATRAVGRASEAAEAAVSEEALRKAESFIEEEEGATNRLVGWAGMAVTAIAVTMSLFHLYTAIAGVPPLFREFPIVATQTLRYTHVAFVLVLCFLLFPVAARYRNRIQWWDVAVAGTAVAILIYAIEGGEDFTDRATIPTRTDIILGVLLIVILLEATRRTIGWIVPVVALAFIAYAMAGPWLPSPWNY